MNEHEIYRYRPTHSSFLGVIILNISIFWNAAWPIRFENWNCFSFSSQDALEVCQTRVSKLELQQQQQQVLQLESADAKVLLGKCINIMLAIVTVILVCVSTAAKFSAPLMRSRLHMFGTFVCMCLLVYTWSNWEHLQCAIERMLLPRWGTWNMHVQWCSRQIKCSSRDVPFIMWLFQDDGYNTFFLVCCVFVCMWMSIHDVL